MQATCECLSWRGALDNLERRHAEDELGETVVPRLSRPRPVRGDHRPHADGSRRVHSRGVAQPYGGRPPAAQPGITHHIGVRASGLQRAARGENGHVIKGLALRLTTSPDAGAVARSLLGVLAMATVALYLGSPAAAMLAAGAGAIAGASALQETPNRRVSLVVAVSLELGVGSLRGRTNRRVQHRVRRRGCGVVLRRGHAVGRWLARRPRRGRGQRAAGRHAAGSAVTFHRPDVDRPDHRGRLGAGGPDRGMATAPLAGAA